MTKFIQNFLVLGATLLVTLGIVELGLRYFMPIDYRPPPSELAYVGRETIYQPSTSPGLDYELKPDVEALAQGVRVTTNSYGMRDDEPLPGNRERIVVIGDSFTFGFGVPQEEIFPILLEQKLNSLEDRYDVLNLSVAGYTIQDEVNILRSKGLTWNPDTVIIGYVLNDPEIEPVQELPSYFDEPYWWQYSHVLRLVARGVKKTQINLYGGGDYYQYLHANQTTWQSVVTGFKEIRGMAAEHDTRVIVLIFPILDYQWEAYPYLAIHQQVAALAEENGFMVVDLTNYMAEYPPQDLRVSLQDGHPNALVHKIAAEALFENFPR
jgi:hypothetical protein